jgi:2-keto-4-pentenoate hydratase
MNDIGRIARVLGEAEKTRRAVGPVSDLVVGGLTADLGHAVCEAGIQARIADGERIAGYKVGATNMHVRLAMGLPDATYGYLMGTMILPTGGELRMDEFIDPRLECEICFRLARDLAGPDLTIEQVLDATEAVSASFELCDSRIKDWKCPYPDWLADNGFAARIVLPDRWLPVGDIDLLEEAVVLTQDGNKIAEGKGEMVLGHPANAVAWLARKLHERGRSLSAGMVVMTGSLTTVTPVERASRYVASFSRLGTVEKRFV